MLGPSIVAQETDKLAALLKVLADPEASKAQLGALSEAAHAALDAEDKLVQERVEYQLLRGDVERLVQDSDVLVLDAKEAVEKANRLVEASLQERNRVQQAVVEVVKEGRELLKKMSSVADDTLAFLDREIEARMQKVLALESAEKAAQKNLDEIESRLASLREKLEV